MMQPFNGNAALAAQTVAEMKAHRDADRLAKGDYWNPETGRGCAIGCLVHSGSHADAGKLCNAPNQIMYIVDNVFEGLPWPANLDWPVKFLEALQANIDKDITLLWARLALEIARHPVHGYEQYNQDPAVLAVPPLYEEWVATGVRPDDDRWRAAARAADAARAALAVNAADDAYHAARAALAALAALAARAAGAALAADAAYYQWLADSIINLINTSPVAVKE
jgi:hypothetical protein